MHINYNLSGWWRETVVVTVQFILTFHVYLKANGDGMRPFCSAAMVENVKKGVSSHESFRYTDAKL